MEGGIELGGPRKTDSKLELISQLKFLQDHGIWYLGFVESESNPKNLYIVSKRYGVWMCECKGFQNYKTCKHVQRYQAKEATENDKHKGL